MFSHHFHRQDLGCQRKYNHNYQAPEMRQGILKIPSQKYELQRQKTYLRTCTTSEDSDQPAHLHSLIRIFIGRIFKKAKKRRRAFYFFPRKDGLPFLSFFLRIDDLLFVYSLEIMVCFFISLLKRYFAFHFFPRKYRLRFMSFLENVDLSFLIMAFNGTPHIFMSYIEERIAFYFFLRKDDPYAGRIYTCNWSCIKIKGEVLRE